MLLCWVISWHHRFDIEITGRGWQEATLSVALPPSVHAIVQPERTAATGSRDGNKWLDTKSGGSFCADFPVERGLYLQFLCLCLRLLSLLNVIIQIPCPCFLIPAGIYPGFARWLEESGEICQSLSLCSPHKQLDLLGLGKKLTAQPISFGFPSTQQTPFR